MQDKVDSGAGTLHRVEVQDVSFAELDAIEYIGNILAPARREVIHAAYLFPT